MVRREKFANGTPEPKPERTFADKLRTLKEVSKGIAPESRLRLLDYFIQEALEKNQITKDQASGIYEQLQQDKDKIRDQIDAYDRVNFAEGTEGRKPMPSGENLTDAQKAGYAKRFNYQKAAKDANFKKLVDNIFKTEDFGNFKAKVTDAQIRAAERAGKVRKGTGVIPAQYIAQFNKAIEAGVDSPEFKEILKITGRSEDEILELNSKRPGGKVVFDVRSKAAEESFPEERKLTEAQKTEKQKKVKAKRGDRLEITTGKAKGLKGSDKFPFHHIMNIGGEIPLTTNDVAIVTKEMTSRLAPYNTKLNDIADGIRENTKLAFEAAVDPIIKKENTPRKMQSVYNQMLGRLVTLGIIPKSEADDFKSVVESQIRDTEKRLESQAVPLPSVEPSNFPVIETGAGVTGAPNTQLASALNLFNKGGIVSAKKVNT